MHCKAQSRSIQFIHISHTKQIFVSLQLTVVSWEHNWYWYWHQGGICSATGLRWPRPTSLATRTCLPGQQLTQCDLENIHLASGSPRLGLQPIATQRFPTSPGYLMAYSDKAVDFMLHVILLMTVYFMDHDSASLSWFCAFALGLIRFNCISIIPDIHR